MSVEHPTAVSLFSGAGGMDVGVMRAGFEVLLANDIDPDACETYRLNHGDIVVEGPISGLTSHLDRLGDVDLVFGGPPCQGFSVAGKMDPGDPRSSLIRSFFDVVDRVGPKAFICENVKGLAVLQKWESVRAELMARAAKAYYAVLVVVNAADYGVPQSRERMFIVGIRKDLWAGSRAEFADAFYTRLESHKRVAPCLGKLISALGPAGSQGNPRVCKAKITFAKAPVMRRSPYAGMLFNGAGRPLSAVGVSSTLPASMGGNKTPIVDEGEIFDGLPSFVEDYHRSLGEGRKPKSGFAPSRLRRLTIDECLRIQTFPSDYRLAGKMSAMFRQIGNAVPCDLAYAVNSSIWPLLGQGENSEPARETVSS